MRIAAFLATLAAAGIFAGSAAAVPPVKFDFSFSDVPGQLTGVCDFDVDITSSGSGTEIDFFDSSGTPTRILVHIVEQDVLSANGKSLDGEPFTFNLDVVFDSEGNVTHVYADGLFERVVLPGGDLFLTAGRADFVAHPGTGFLIQPDFGAQGNIAGFCAALSP
jgi:hypothetical protein